MPFEPRCPPVRGLVVPVRVDPTGARGPTKARAAGPRWRRVRPGLYVPADVDADRPEQRVLETACDLPPGGAVTGWGALRLAGAAYFDGRPDGYGARPVALVVPPRQGQRCRPGVRWSYESCDRDDLVVLHGVRCLHPRRALVDEVRTLDRLRDRVVALDMAVAAEITSLRRVAAYLDGVPVRGAGRVHEALSLAREGSRSPPETRLRLVWTQEAELPEPWVNRRVEDLEGRLICNPDLFDEEAGTVVEYDGEEHRSAARHDHDVRRQERCRRAGLEYVIVTSRDLHRRPALVERLRASRARSRFAAVGDRAWRVAPAPARSLDDELDEREWRSEELWRARGVRVLPW